MARENYYLVIYQKRGEFFPTEEYALVYASSNDMAYKKAKKHLSEYWIKDVITDWDHNLIENEPDVKRIR